MKYERLTERSKDGYAHYKCSEEEREDCELYYNCGECHKSTEVLYRLAKLEDKIENGTMIELGYYIRKSYRNHDDQRYKIVLVEENEIEFFNCDGLTREEAEAKLKELQE